MIANLLLVLVVFYITWKRKVSNINLQEIPVYPGDIPILGHLHLFYGNRKHIWKRFMNISKTAMQSGGVMQVFLGPVHIYMITDPDDSQIIANTCLTKAYPYHFAKKWIGSGLLISSGDKWKYGKKLLSPFFSNNAVMQYMGIFNEKSRKLVKTLEEKVEREYFDVWPYLALIGLETITLTTLGLNIENEIIIGKRYMENIGKYTKLLLQKCVWLWMQIDFVYRWTPYWKEEKKILNDLYEITNTIVENRKEKMESGENMTDFKPLADALIEVSRENGSLTSDEIRQHVDTMVAAGHDTSAATIVFILKMLAIHQDVQEKVDNELYEVFGDSHRDVEKDDLLRMKYLEAVIKETLRHYPIGPFTIRKLHRDVKLSKCVLKSGSYALISYQGIHRHSSWGKDALDFRPERFLDGSTPTNPAAFVPFSMGRRTCIGKTYAMAAMKVTLSHLLRHYSVETNDKEIEIRFGIVIKPFSGSEIMLKKRKVVGVY